MKKGWPHSIAANLFVSTRQYQRGYPSALQQQGLGQQQLLWLGQQHQYIAFT